MCRPTMFLIAGALVAGGCKGEANSAPAAGTIAINTTPVLDISPTESDTLPAFIDAVGATRLASGAIAVADRGGSAVVLFDSTGRFVRRVGGDGDGPGEYRSVARIGQCAKDTLFVWDQGAERMTVLGPGGDFARSFRPPGLPWPGLCAASNEYAVATEVTGAYSAAPDAPPMHGKMLLVSGEGDSVRSLGDMPLYRFRALTPFTVIAPSPIGVYVGLGDSAVVSLYAPDGRLLRTIAAGLDKRSPTPAEYEAAIDALMSVFRDAAMRASGKEVALKTPMPEFVPAYRAILSDADGTLYVVSTPLGAGDTVIQVFRSDGGSMGEITIPGDFDLYEVGGGYLLGRSTDAEGRQHVVLFVLRTSAA